MSGLKVGFLGAGRMASAIAAGLVTSKHCEAQDILASDIVPATAFLAAAPGAKSTESNVDVVRHANVVFIAVKPHQVAAVLDEVKGALTGNTLLISIAAGISITSLESHAGPARVVRVMPNVGALSNSSASAFSLGTKATKDDSQLVQSLLRSVGVAHEVKESLLDAVTGLSGGGPAYVAMFCEAMVDGGVASGLPRDVATALAAQTIIATGKMILEQGIHPGVVKDMVTSPGGTTIEGVQALEKGGMRAAAMEAVRAAAGKATALGKANL